MHSLFIFLTLCNLYILLTIYIQVDCFTPHNTIPFLLLLLLLLPPPPSSGLQEFYQYKKSLLVGQGLCRTALQTKLLDIQEEGTKLYGEKGNSNIRQFFLAFSYPTKKISFSIGT